MLRVDDHSTHCGHILLERVKINIGGPPGLHSTRRGQTLRSNSTSRHTPLPHFLPSDSMRAWPIRAMLLPSKNPKRKHCHPSGLPSLKQLLFPARFEHRSDAQSVPVPRPSHATKRCTRVIGTHVPENILVTKKKREKS